MSYELVETDEGVVIDRGEAGLLRIGHIIGVGRNYAEHASEMGGEVPERPMFFTKNPASACVSGSMIRIPPICRHPETGGPEQVDFEAELVVIVGERCRDVPESRALEVALGFCCGNDVSARWWQKEGSGGQFCRGKSFDTFCPLGPIVRTLEEVGDPQALAIECRVGGETMQSASTADMIFPVARLIAELSAGTTLLPGTAILTGTPSGVGHGRSPRRYLRHGETAEVEIERIGVLTNTVAHEVEGVR
ncbi:MAG: fumarylacetoacetate hydrolase family protein [Phycisphaerales bacterium]